MADQRRRHAAARCPAPRRMVSANLAGSAVSSTIIGTPRIAVLARHLQAVGGVGVDHRRRSAARCRGSSPAGRHACCCRRRSRRPALRANSSRVEREAAVARRLLAEQRRACARASRPSRSKTKRSKLDALRDVHRRARGLVRLGAAAHAVACRCGRTRRARRSRWWPAPAGRSAGPSCAPRGRRRCCRSCPTARRSRTRLGRRREWPGSSRRSSRPPAPAGAPS